MRSKYRNILTFLRIGSKYQDILNPVSIRPFLESDRNLANHISSSNPPPLLKSSSSHTSTPHKMQNHRMAPVCKRPHDSPKVSSTLFKPSGLLSNHQVSTQSPFSEHRPPQRRRDGKEAGLRHRQANTPTQIQRHRTSGGGGIIFLDQGESFVGCKDIKPFIEPYNP